MSVQGLPSSHFDHPPKGSDKRYLKTQCFSKLGTPQAIHNHSFQVRQVKKHGEPIYSTTTGLQQPPKLEIQLDLRCGTSSQHPRTTTELKPLVVHHASGLLQVVLRMSEWHPLVFLTSLPRATMLFHLLTWDASS